LVNSTQECPEEPWPELGPYLADLSQALIEQGDYFRRDPFPLPRAELKDRLAYLTEKFR
jgi:hypothetical protein